MSTNYQNVWEAMNSLEQVTSKIISAREILNASRDCLERHEYERTETLIVAAQEFLAYYLSEFDDKFKAAWNETVVKSKTDGFYWDTDPKGNLVDWTSNGLFTNDCNSDTIDWTEPSKTSWTLPVEQVNNGDSGEIDYFITLPEDLLEKTGWDEGTELVWGDLGNGSYTLKKL